MYIYVVCILRPVKYFDIIAMEDWNAYRTRPNRIFRRNSKTSHVTSFGHKFSPYTTIICVIEEKATNDPSFIGFRNERMLRKPYMRARDRLPLYKLKMMDDWMLSEATGFQRMLLKNVFYI